MKQVIGALTIDTAVGSTYCGWCNYEGMRQGRPNGIPRWATLKNCERHSGAGKAPAPNNNRAFAAAAILIFGVSIFGLQGKVRGTSLAHNQVQRGATPRPATSFAGQDVRLVATPRPGADAHDVPAPVSFSPYQTEGGNPTASNRSAMLRSLCGRAPVSYTGKLPSDVKPSVILL